MAIPFIASYISGVTLQVDDATSGVPRSYVDQISGALDSRIDALAGVTGVEFGTLTATVAGGIAPFPAGTFAVSSQSGTSLALSIEGYSTISSNAKIGAASGVKVVDSFDHDLYATSANVIANYVASEQARINFAWSSALVPTREWFEASSQSLSAYQASGDEYSAAYASGKRVVDPFDHELFATSANSLANFAGSANLAGVSAWYTASAQKYSNWAASGTTLGALNDWMILSGAAYSEIEASGGKYSQAYASAQKLKEGAFITVASGWFFASDQSAIPHTLGVKPNHVTITPSGDVTYATAFTVDEININLRVSHASQRTVNWRAEI